VSQIVPWTDPGGAPCCCNICTNNEISTFYQFTGLPSVYAYQKIDAETFAAIRQNGFSINYKFNVTPQIGVLSPGPIDAQITVPYSGFCTNVIVPLSTGPLPLTSLLLTRPDGVIYTIAIYSRFTMFIQDGGSGWPVSDGSPTPTSSEPVVYFTANDFTSGGFVVVASSPLSGINECEARIGGSQSSTVSFSLFGQAKTASLINGAGSTIVFAIDVAAP
jgi:hypothetical protein